MSKSKQLPASTLTVTIGQNSYAIDFPSNGKLIQIERYKSELTGGMSRQMLVNGSSGMQAFIASEAIATFTVLLPKLSKDLNVSLLDLDQMQSKSLIKAYEKYYEWMESWRDVLNEDSEKDSEKDSEEEKKEAE